MEGLWGNRFQFGARGTEVVPLAIYATLEQRQALRLDEGTYQRMLAAAREANPDLEGEPLFVDAYDGEFVPIGGWPTYEDVIRAGVDVGDRSKGRPLPYVLYQEECERRDVETLYREEVEAPISRGMTLNELLDNAFDDAMHYLKDCLRDGEMSEGAYDAARRQTEREFAALRRNGYSTLTLEELVRDARDWEELGRYAAVTITPGDVQDRIGDEESFPQYAEIDFEEVAQSASENFRTDGIIADMVYDQIVAEADNLVEQPRPRVTLRDRIVCLASPLDVMNALEGHAPLTSSDAGLFSSDELSDLVERGDPGLDAGAIDDARAEAFARGIREPVFQLGEFGGCTALGKIDVARALGFGTADLWADAPAWLDDLVGNPPLSAATRGARYGAVREEARDGGRDAAR